MRDILRIAQAPISLERPVGEEDSELGDFLEDEQSPSPFDEASLNLRSRDVRRVLKSLPERERKVHRSCASARRRPPHARGGRAGFGVTRERIRQIENNTLRKLGNLPEARRLRDLA